MIRSKMERREEDIGKGKIKEHSEIRARKLEETEMNRYMQKEKNDETKERKDERQAKE
jgi:hypothetical protein